MKENAQPQVRPQLEELMWMRDRAVHDVNGERFGKLVDVYYDKATRVPEWLGIDAALLGMRRIVAPTLGARIEGDAVRIAYAKEVALDTPEVRDQEISQDVERNLYAHYGLVYTYDESPTGLPAASDEPSHPPARQFGRWAWPDIPEDEQIGFDSVDVADATDTRLRAFPATQFDKWEAGEGERGAREFLREHPEAPWFGAAIITLCLSILAGTLSLRWAVALLRLEAVALLGIAIIEKRRKQAMHEAFADAHPDEEKPSIAERVKAKVGMA